jgi:hypothetical protein
MPPEPPWYNGGGSELLGSAIKCSFTFYAHALLAKASRVTVFDHNFVSSELALRGTACYAASASFPGQ